MQGPVPDPRRSECLLADGSGNSTPTQDLRRSTGTASSTASRRLSTTTSASTPGPRASRLVRSSLEGSGSPAPSSGGPAASARSPRGISRLPTTAEEVRGSTGSTGTSAFRGASETGAGAQGGDDDDHHGEGWMAAHGRAGGGTGASGNRDLPRRTASRSRLVISDAGHSRSPSSASGRTPGKKEPTTPPTSGRSGGVFSPILKPGVQPSVSRSTTKIPARPLTPAANAGLASPTSSQRYLGIGGGSGLTSPTARASTASPRSTAEQLPWSATGSQIGSGNTSRVTAALGLADADDAPSAAGASALVVYSSGQPPAKQSSPVVPREEHERLKLQLESKLEASLRYRISATTCLPDADSKPSSYNTQQPVAVLERDTCASSTQARTVTSEIMSSQAAWAGGKMLLLAQAEQDSRHVLRDVTMKALTVVLEAQPQMQGMLADLDPTSPITLERLEAALDTLRGNDHGYSVGDLEELLTVGAGGGAA